MTSRLKERTAVKVCSPRADGRWLVVALDGRSLVSEVELSAGHPLNIPIDKRGGRR